MRNIGQISGMTSCFGVLKRVVWRRAGMTEESNMVEESYLTEKKKIYIYKGLFLLVFYVHTVNGYLAISLYDLIFFVLRKLS